MAFLAEGIQAALHNKVVYRAVTGLFGKLQFSADVAVNVRGQKLYVNTPDRLLAAFLWKFALLENYETILLRRLARPGMRAVDIGANIGYYTLLLARLTGPAGQILAFEPDPNNYRLLSKNIACNQIATVTAIAKGVSNENGGALLFLNRGHRGDHRIFDETGKRPSLAIETTTLDAALAGRRVDLIKMDIQGAEHLAFQGMHAVIRRNPAIAIITEFTPHLLEECGSGAHAYLDAIENAGLTYKLINEKSRCLEPVDRVTLLARCSGSRYGNLLLRSATSRS